MAVFDFRKRNPLVFVSIAANGLLQVPGDGLPSIQVSRKVNTVCLIR